MSKERLDNSVLENAISTYKTVVEVAGDIIDEDYSPVLDKVTLAFLEELKQYRDLEEQGLLLRLPCKIGDKVYAITRDFVSEYTICNIEVYNEGFFFNWKCEKGIYINIRGFTHYQIGVDIFLTQSEAEEKLRELNKKARNNL